MEYSLEEEDFVFVSHLICNHKKSSKLNLEAQWVPTSPNSEPDDIKIAAFAGNFIYMGVPGQTLIKYDS